MNKGNKRFESLVLMGRDILTWGSERSRLGKCEHKGTGAGGVRRRHQNRGGKGSYDANRKYSAFEMGFGIMGRKNTRENAETDHYPAERKKRIPVPREKGSCCANIESLRQRAGDETRDPTGTGIEYGEGGEGA